MQGKGGEGGRARAATAWKRRQHGHCGCRRFAVAAVTTLAAAAKKGCRPPLPPHCQEKTNRYRRRRQRRPQPTRHPNVRGPSWPPPSLRRLPAARRRRLPLRAVRHRYPQLRPPRLFPSAATHHSTRGGGRGPPLATRRRRSPPLTPHTPPPPPRQILPTVRWEEGEGQGGGETPQASFLWPLPPSRPPVCPPARPPTQPPTGYVLDARVRACVRACKAPRGERAGVKGGGGARAAGEWREKRVWWVGVARRRGAAARWVRPP